MYSEQEIQAIDLQRAKQFEPKSLQKYKANKAQSLPTDFFDQDVQEILKQHNNAHDRQRANTVLRALFA